MKLVKCKRCGENIDREKELFVKLSTGYAHKECEDKFQINKNTVTCQVCRGKINKLTDSFLKRNTGYVHTNCVPVDEKDKIELYNYISQLFHLKTPGPANMAMIKKYYTTNKYSYRSMLYTLKYFYEIKKEDISKADERIGIIPYVYDEAKEYYSKLASLQTKVAANIQKQQLKANNVIIVKKVKRIKKLIDLEELN